MVYKNIPHLFQKEMLLYLKGLFPLPLFLKNSTLALKSSLKIYEKDKKRNRRKEEKPFIKTTTTTTLTTWDFPVINKHVRITLLSIYIPIFLFSLIGLISLFKYLQKSPGPSSPFLKMVIKVTFSGVIVGTQRTKFII